MIRNFTRILLFVLTPVLCWQTAYSQAPSNCLEIESILVDPCGLSEPQNEMVRFRVGPAPLNINQLLVEWPQGPWNVVCNGPTTINVLQQLNNTIQGCGALIDPPGGILPAGAKVILFTSTTVSPSNNSFVNLQDTLYAVFQCNSSTTTPYFPNYSASSTPRELIIRFNMPAGCGDTVAYQQNQLVNFAGNPGPGNGARVDFTWSGTASYFNDGCFGPFPPLAADAGEDTTICLGDTARLIGQVDQSFGFQWSGGSGTIRYPDSLATRYTPAPGEMGIIPFVLTAWSSCDTVRDTVNVWIIDTIMANLGQDRVICTGGNTVLNAGYPGSTFLWSTGVTTQTLNVTAGGTYSVTITNGCGSDADTLIVTESPGPTVQAGPNQTICITDIAALTGTVSSGTIQWQTNGGGTFSAPTNSTTNYTPAANDVGVVQFILEVNDACGTITDTLEITFIPEIAGSITYTDSLCANEAIPLAYSGNADSIRWSGGLGQFSDDTAAATLYQPLISESGIVEIYATTGNLCGTQTDTIRLYVREKLVADFNCTPENAPAGTEIVFTNMSSGSIQNTRWSFGDSTGSLDDSPQHTFNDAGSYTVQLVVSGEPACPDTATKVVTVTTGELVVPNVLTPNGDGINDDFLLKVPPVQTYLLALYDRWGHEVFISQNPLDAWDGNSTVGMAPEGVYFYVLKLTTVDFQSIKQTGTVVLMR